MPRNPRDLKAGERLRFDAYQAAWTKCADRIEVRRFLLTLLGLSNEAQEVVSRLRAPVVANVVAEIKHSYTRILPGLPRTELPVIAVSGAWYNCKTVLLASYKSLISQVVRRFFPMSSKHSQSVNHCPKNTQAHRSRRSIWLTLFTSIHPTARVPHQV